MSRKHHICFVGQGPNRKCWEREVAKGGEAWAEAESARLALTGSVGTKLASMLGMERLEFCVTFRRENLNHRFYGKQGKGDAFNNDEARLRARLLDDHSSAKKFVLLGREVAASFGITHGFLSHLRIGGKEYLLLPHPSGINSWWNNPENKQRAIEALRKFVNE